MLSNMQQLTIKVAVGKAADKDAEIKKLAEGFPAPEEEIRAYWNEISGTTAVKTATKTTPSAAAGSARGKRVFWTDEMLQQLTDLRERGETYSRIAEMMGLDVKQVQNKIQRFPKTDRLTTALVEKVPTSESKPELPVKPVSVPKTATELSDSDLQISSGCRGPVDMPWALGLILDLVKGQISEDVNLVYGNNDEGRAACSFRVNGIEYSLKLEVLE